MSSEKSPSNNESNFSGTALKFFGLAAIILIGIAIYTIPRMPTSPWASSLSKPKIHASTRQPVPQFEWSNGTNALKSTDFKGHWTLLSFWAHWCAPCLEELPELTDLAESWEGPQLDIITVNIDAAKSENLELAKTFLAENNINLPVLFDGEAKLKAAFAVNELPRHFLINPEGEIVWDAIGAMKWSTSHASLMKLIEPTQAPLEADPVE